MKSKKSLFPSEPKVYQCPRCATSMEVDPSAKVSEPKDSREKLRIEYNFRIDELVSAVEKRDAELSFLKARMGEIERVVWENWLPSERSRDGAKCNSIMQANMKRVSTAIVKHLIRYLDKIMNYDRRNIWNAIKSGGTSYGYKWKR